tara:strand:- start:170 stop:1849 length:1680 start_codon:yes stop_codon:yes gene_type:complete
MLDKYINFASKQPKNIQIKNLESLYNNKNFFELIKYSEVFLKKFPESKFIYNLIGVAYFNLGKYSSAIENYNISISLNPKNSEAYNNKGLCLKKMRDFEGALENFKLALKINPHFSDVYNNIGNLYYELKSFKDAEKIWSDGLKVSPTDIVLLRNLGTLLFEKKGEISLSKKNFEKILALSPNKPFALNYLGMIYKSEGKIDEAEDYFKKAIEADSNYSESYYNLSYLKKFNKQNNFLRKLEKLYSSKQVFEEDKVYICFSLAKAFDDLGKYSLSYKYLSEGNLLRKKLIGYNINKDKKLFSKIYKNFKQLQNDNLKLPDYNNLNNKVPIFILGMPRSGTTLVEQIISTHSKVFGAGELNILSNSIYKLDILNNKVSEDLLLKLRNNYLAHINEFNTSRKMVVDKLPANYLWIGLIFTIFPNAKVIHVKRNAVATCWSNYTKYYSNPGIGFVYSLGDLGKYYKMYLEMINYWDNHFPGKIHSLNYETLTEEPINEIRNLISYLDLKWEDECLKFYKNPRIVKTASSLQVRQKIYKGSSRKWLNYSQFLSKLEKELGTYF